MCRIKIGRNLALIRPETTVTSEVRVLKPRIFKQLGRKWSELELKEFPSVLADDRNEFALTLETRLIENSGPVSSENTTHCSLFSEKSRFLTHSTKWSRIQQN